jgi:predicted metal-dependent hydrolase
MKNHINPGGRSRTPGYHLTLKHEEIDLNRGIDLFNRAHFFDAHEVLEDVWRPLPRDRPVRRHLQGMVQLAVAFHHHSTGNHIGARSVLDRALRNLRGAESSFPHLDLDRLRAELADWQEHLACRVRQPKPPQILTRKLTP